MFASMWVRRTALTLAAALAFAAAAPSSSRALGESSLFDARSVDYTGGNAHPRESAPRRLAWEVRKRTSIDASLEPTSARLDDPAIFETPFLYWSGDAAFPELSEAEVQGLRRFVSFGGFVVIDDASPEGDDGFDGSVRRELGRAGPPILTNSSPSPISNTASTATMMNNGLLRRRRASPAGRATRSPGRGFLVSGLAVALGAGASSSPSIC
jgi:hypothetical protein